MEHQNTVSRQKGLPCESAPFFADNYPENAGTVCPDKPAIKKTNENGPAESDKDDKIFAWLYLLLGYGFIFTFTSGYLIFGRNLAIYTAAYAAVVMVYIIRKGIRPAGESYFWMLILLAAAIPYAFWTVMPGLQILAVIFLAAYWTLNMTGGFLEGHKTSQWLAADCINAFIIVPFTNFTCHFKVLKNCFKSGNTDNKTAGKMGSILLGLIIAVPLMMVILPILSSADADFQKLMASGIWYMEDHFLLTVIRLILSIPVMCYLFGLIYGGIHKRYASCISRETAQSTGKTLRLLPDTAVFTAVSAVCIVYLLFMAIQGRYLFSAFWGTMPQNFTYAEYARRGFFELCGIALLNLCLLVAANMFSQTERRKNKLLTAANIMLAVLTLLLIFTAMSKMMMYISVFGLTVKRILTMAFMVWMTIVYTLVIIWQKREIAMIRISVFSGALIFILLCVIPVQYCISMYS